MSMYEYINYDVQLHCGVLPPVMIGGVSHPVYFAEIKLTDRDLLLLAGIVTGGFSEADGPKLVREASNGEIYIPRIHGIGKGGRVIGISFVTDDFRTVVDGLEMLGYKVNLQYVLGGESSRFYRRPHAVSKIYLQ